MHCFRSQVSTTLKLQSSSALFFQVHNGPISGGAVTLKTGTREMPGPNPGRACQPSRSEFSVVFSETCVNKGYDP